MNNLQSDNAKSEILDVKNTKNRRKCDTVRVLFGDGTVRESPIEEYVKGCVMGEMPLSFEVQALMAQCVAVRTFTVRQALCGTSKHKNADVCTNPACCQSYAEISNLKSPQSIKKLEDAVNATRGIIMTYGGEPIEAVYHASSGTSTLNSEDVWGGRVEYLRSVKAPDGERAIAAGGMGHRVGLSQHGANILAKDGLSYTDILHYYYAGISFDFLL